MSIEKLLTWVGNDPIRWALVITVIAIVTTLVLYLAVRGITGIFRNLRQRRILLRQVELFENRLLAKKQTLEARWTSFSLLETMEGAFVDPGPRARSERSRQKVLPKLSKLQGGRIKQARRKVGERLSKARAGLYAFFAKRMKVVGPVDWPFWLFWAPIYCVFVLVDTVVSTLALMWPTRTLSRLEPRLAYLFSLIVETSEANDEIGRLRESSDYLALEDRKASEEQKRAKEAARVERKKRGQLRGLKDELSLAIEFHLVRPTREITGGSMVLNYDQASLRWQKYIPELEALERAGVELDELLARASAILNLFQTISLEGNPKPSRIQESAKKVAKAEKALEVAVKAFAEKKQFSAITGVNLQEPEELEQAIKLLKECSLLWVESRLEELASLAGNTLTLIEDAEKDIRNIGDWETNILSAINELAVIKEDEAALAAYGVKLPPNPGWKDAVGTLEKRVPQVWAKLDWPKLAELYNGIKAAFEKRRELIRSRMEAERNKRVIRGEVLPKGQELRRGKGSSAATETRTSTETPAPRGSTRKGVDYNPRSISGDLVWVRSKISKFVYQVDKTLASGPDFEILSPDDPAVLSQLGQQG